ncbi:hypothetical protein ABZY44_25170 [Streptomyces sp. NPDC006544]|uniref:hypothetical protein n=1 Tax=Streptomyces sp. NPDC006544 TaxID=3154583 RepID=UPI0033A55FB8
MRCRLRGLRGQDHQGRHDTVRISAARTTQPRLDTTQKREERKDKTTGKTFNARDGFEQRGWRLVVEYWEGVEGAGGTKISLIGLDDACMKANGFKEPTT